MALPESIIESLKEAEGSIRNALAYAARSENPVVCTTLAQILNELQSITTYDKMMEKLHDLKDENGGPPFPHFF